MRGMVLAAGRGTRLRPLTETVPKALVEVEGRPLLGILLEKLRAHGATGVVVNAHHLADRIEHFIDKIIDPPGWVRISREEALLGTGGGVRNAAPLLGGDEPVLVHNVDVLCNLPFRALAARQEEAGSSVTLAVGGRPSTRSLAADEEDLLCGRWGEAPVRAPSGSLRRVAFSGIQILAPGVVSRLPGEGAFSLIDAYLALASAGEPVRVFPIDDWYWAEVGTPERLDRLKADLALRAIPIESLAR